MYLGYTYALLWSQIKLTSCDVSDLQITGEFDNRPGTGRFLRIFSCVVTYRTGAGRRLYTMASADARPGTVRRPANDCRDRPRFRTGEKKLSSQDHQLPKCLRRNRLRKIERQKPESDSEGGDETLSVDIEEKIAEFLRRGLFITARQTLIIKKQRATEPRTVRICC